MSQLVIGSQNIEIRTAIKTLNANIHLLKAKLSLVNPDSELGQKAHYFYSSKLHQQETILQWLTNCTGTHA